MKTKENDRYVITVCKTDIRGRIVRRKRYVHAAAAGVPPKPRNIISEIDATQCLANARIIGCKREEQQVAINIYLRWTRYKLAGLQRNPDGARVAAPAPRNNNGPVNMSLFLSHKHHVRMAK